MHSSFFSWFSFRSSTRPSERRSENGRGATVTRNLPLSGGVHVVGSSPTGGLVHVSRFAQLASHAHPPSADARNASAPHTAGELRLVAACGRGRGEVIHSRGCVLPALDLPLSGGVPDKCARKARDGDW